ncbi:uncharacterized protein LOC125811244 [Solanum verrucosum]|uniref:uncharacterized protein LOC125811244 n=1 Tax=Solanum verrucosum TaxID=315347 RepID=UPI0020D0555E|nr:uncharacterized protein LOC125811244 [Solanum verrucosum]
MLANSLVRLQILEESDGMIAFIEARSSLVEKILEHQFDDDKLCIIREKMLRGEAKEVVLDSDGVLNIRGMIYVPKTSELIRLILEEGHCSQYSIYPRATKMCHDQSQVLAPVSRGYISEDAYSYLEVKYTTKKLAELYISQIVRLHRVPVLLSLIKVHCSLPISGRHYIMGWMAPFETLYGRHCRSLIGCFDSAEMDSLDTELLRDSMDQVRMIQYRLLTAQS